MHVRMHACICDIYIHSEEPNLKNRSGQDSRMYDIKVPVQSSERHTLLSHTLRAMEHLHHLQSPNTKIKLKRCVMCHQKSTKAPSWSPAWFVPQVCLPSHHSRSDCAPLWYRIASQAH